VAILATLLATRLASHVASAVKAAAPGAKQAAAQHGLLLAFHDTFAVAVIFGVVGVFFAFLIHDEDAAGTMQQRAPGMAMAE
jgi:hypothetical protein